MCDPTLANVIMEILENTTSPQCGMFAKNNPHDSPLPSWNVPGPCNSPERAVARHFFPAKVFCKYTKFASTSFDHWFYPPTLYFNNVKKDCTFGTGGHPLPASFVTWPLKIKMTNYKLHVPSLVSKLPVLIEFTYWLTVCLKAEEIKKTSQQVGIWQMNRLDEYIEKMYSLKYFIGLPVRKITFSHLSPV